MEFQDILLSIAAITVGVAAITYILLRRPRTPASIGSESEIALGDEVIDETGEETDLPTEEPAAEEGGETAESEENANA